MYGFHSHTNETDNRPTNNNITPECPIIGRFGVGVESGFSGVTDV